MTTIHDTIAQIEALEAKATPGPWSTLIIRPYSGSDGIPEPLALRTGGPRFVSYDRSSYLCADDAVFINEIRNAAPSLIAYVRALERVSDAAIEVTKDVDRLERFESIGSVRLEAMEYLARTIEALAAAREEGR